MVAAAADAEDAVPEEAAAAAPPPEAAAAPARAAAPRTLQRQRPAAAAGPSRTLKTARVSSKVRRPSRTRSPPTIRSSRRRSAYSRAINSPPTRRRRRYDFGAVPQVAPDLSGSVLLRPTSRRQWFACIQELESLAQESLDRRAARLQMNTPSGLPLVYIADRMDIDDPLWGYQLRCEDSGWLQGFITCTVFTTWTHFFEWNSCHVSSGMAAARVANSMVGKPDPALTSSEGGETVQQVAQRAGIKPADLVKWNISRFANISVNSRVQAGTVFYVVDPASVDTVVIEKPNETPKKLAARLGVSVTDLIELNQNTMPELAPTTKLEKGARLVYRDRSSEPDVFLPTRKQERALDEDGSIAAALQGQHRYGDPTTTGVVWPKVAEIGLVGGLGAGKTLVRLALEELRASAEFDFAVLRATTASVSVDFVRVAPLLYFPEGTSLDSNPIQGYRHWACADESRPDEFGDTSYMMAVKLTSLTPNKSLPKQLKPRLVDDWPSVQSSGGPKSHKKGKSHHAKTGHNQTGILAPKGSELQVGDMSLNIEDGDDARLQLRYEVEKIVDFRNGQYLVKWRHLAVEEATWEKPEGELMQSPAAKAAIARFRKQPEGGKRKADGDAPRSHKKGAGSSSDGSALPSIRPAEPPKWSEKVVRPIRDLYPAVSAITSSPRIFNGGLGEPPRQRMFADQPVDAGPPGLEREHRYWLVVRYASMSNKCTLVPLLANGRFGGTGRRAGRIRWRPAPLKQGYERDAAASTLELVPAESVQGAREAEGGLVHRRYGRRAGRTRAGGGRAQSAALAPRRLARRGGACRADRRGGAGHGGTRSGIVRGDILPDLRGSVATTWGHRRGRRRLRANARGRQLEAARPERAAAQEEAVSARKQLVPGVHQGQALRAHMRRTWQGRRGGGCGQGRRGSGSGSGRRNGGGRLLLGGRVQLNSRRVPSVAKRGRHVCKLLVKKSPGWACADEGLEGCRCNGERAREWSWKRARWAVVCAARGASGFLLGRHRWSHEETERLTGHRLARATSPLVAHAQNRTRVARVE